jgi:hypothetical protein
VDKGLSILAIVWARTLPSKKTLDVLSTPACGRVYRVFWFGEMGEKTTSRGRGRPPKVTVGSETAELLGDDLKAIGRGDLGAVGPLIHRLCAARLEGRISSEQAKDLASLIRAAVGLAKPLRDERADKRLRKLIERSARVRDDARRRRATVGPPPGEGVDGRDGLREAAEVEKDSKA